MFRQLYDGDDLYGDVAFDRSASALIDFEAHVPELVASGILEAFIERECKEMWANEVRAYDRLHELQGTSLPRMYGTVTTSGEGE